MNQQAYNLVHANVATARAPLDHPIMAGFVELLDRVNHAAQLAPGFIAQPTLPDEGEVFSERMLLNLSIWESVEALDRFTYQGLHALALERRGAWFEQSDRPNYVLFWVPARHIPSEREVKRRIDHLARHGPTPFAFTFNQRFRPGEMLDYSPANEAASRTK